MNDFLSEQEVNALGLAVCGKDVRISRHALIFSPEKVTIGNHVRIDAFTVLSGKIVLHNYIHIGAAVFMYGADAGIVMKDFSTISSRSSIYAVNDDYSGQWMSNPMVPEELRGVEEKPVIIGRHAMVGTSCTLLPGAVVNEGTVLGAMSLAKTVLSPWVIYAGIPCHKIRERKKNPLLLEKQIPED